MELVIKLDDETYKEVMDRTEFDTLVLGIKLIEAVQRGTPLEEKGGHWIKYGSPRCGEQHYQCTSCGYYINFGQWGELYTKEFKYCPNCSAKMEGENKE